MHRAQIPVSEYEQLDTPRTQHFKEAVSRIGMVTLTEPGANITRMKVLQFPKKAVNGLELSFVRLTPEWQGDCTWASDSSRAASAGPGEFVARVFLPFRIQTD